MRNNSILNWLKSYKKTFIFGIFFSIITVGFGLLFVNWTNLEIIYAAGSSAVSPLLEELNYTYRNVTKKNIDMNVLPTGSGNGIESIANGNKNLGNISRSPSEKETGLPAIDGKGAQEGTYSKEWESNKLKTVTWGWDTICIIYKPKNGDFILDINNSNILDLYQCIAGTKSFNLNDFKSKDSSVNDNTQIKPFARTGGAEKSGTTEAFIKSSHFQSAQWNEIKKLNYIKNLEIGKYTNSVQTTKESNIETWKTISVDGDYGAMTYLSGGFVLSNIQEISNAGFKVATYNNIPLLSENITNGYNWFRPLNSIVSIDAPQYVKDWVYWVVSGLYSLDQNVINAFNIINIIPLNQKQIRSMCLNEQFDNNSFWNSDYFLYVNKKPLPFGASE